MTLGELVLVAVPGEFTTMSGRLLRKAVLKVTIQYCTQYNTIQYNTVLYNIILYNIILYNIIIMCTCINILSVGYFKTTELKLQIF